MRTHKHTCTHSQRQTHIRNKSTTKKEDTHTIGTHALRNTLTYTRTYIAHTHCYTEQQKHAHACVLVPNIFIPLEAIPHLLHNPTFVKYATQQSNPYFLVLRER